MLRIHYSHFFVEYNVDVIAKTVDKANGLLHDGTSFAEIPF